jgi:hypothetical protein
MSSIKKILREASLQICDKAADHIEAQDRRIAELESQIAAQAGQDALAISKELRIVSAADLIESLCRALIDLVNQIIKTNPIDDHGHNLQTNRAFLESVKLLDSIAAAPPAPANAIDAERYRFLRKLENDKNPQQYDAVVDAAMKAQS